MQRQSQVRVWKSEALPPDWFKRQKADEKAVQEVENSVKAIIKQVKENGNDALVEFALKFDKAELTLRTLKVKTEEIKEAYKEESCQPRTSLRTKIHERKSQRLPKATAHPN